MKKLFALLLALIMVLSLAACGGDETPSSSEDKTPGSTQQQEDNTTAPDEGNDEPDNSGEEPSGNKDEFTGYEWPSADYITGGMKWTGSGKIVKLSEETDTSRETNKEITRYSIYIETATLDEVSAYIDALKADGFVYYTHIGYDEPAVEFDETKMFKWDGEANDGRFLKLTLYSDELARGGYDREQDKEYTYKLEIVAYNASPNTEPNQNPAL